MTNEKLDELEALIEDAADLGFMGGNDMERWIRSVRGALPELVAMGKDYAKLNEPDGVLINMMRGTIPKVGAASLHKLYTEDELLAAARSAALKGPTT